MQLLGAGHEVNSPAHHPLSLPFPRLQVRKAAQHGVCSILRGSEFLFGDGAPSHHPAASSAAKFCVQEIEKAGGIGDGRFMSCVLLIFASCSGTNLPEGWAVSFIIINCVGEGSSARPLWFSRCQRGHNYSSCTHPAARLAALPACPICQILLRDPPSSYDPQPCGELSSVG